MLSHVNCFSNQLDFGSGSWILGCTKQFLVIFTAQVVKFGMSLHAASVSSLHPFSVTLRVFPCQGPLNARSQYGTRRRDWHEPASGARIEEHSGNHRTSITLIQCQDLDISYNLSHRCSIAKQLGAFGMSHLVEQGSKSTELSGGHRLSTSGS